MSRVLILVEGQTEETFVREVLEPHLQSRGVFAIPTLVVTKFVKSGGRFQGGITSFEKVERDVRRLLGDTDAALVTTMFDYYGLPDDFPGMNTRPRATCYERVQHVEKEVRRSINHGRFRPYLALHEFEAFVFVDPTKCRFAFDGSATIVRQLEAVRARFAGPEEIDEGVTTAPSKRLRAIFPAYQKTLHGPVVAIETGLEALRHSCPHFDRWVRELEALA